MIRRLAALLALLALLSPLAATADPADIDAAARGVVRIVIVEHEGDSVIAVSHGTGFAVSPERIVTNSHVIQQAQDDPNLFIGIVPSDGEEAVYGRVVSVSERNDLALIATTKAMNLPPLTISGNPETSSGVVTAVGYPMNVDRAQGLGMADIFKATPPVKATGSLAGRRPSRQFDTLLHTAPIARGNSGGPLVDQCGRVIGVNSFGAESGSAEAEFYFAVSTRELLPFLRAYDITPQINAMPCRSLADVDAEERQRAQAAASAEEARARAEEQALARRSEEARRGVEFAILDERDNGLALAMLLIVIALGAGGFGLLAHEQGNARKGRIASAVAVAALVAAAAAWFMRPPFTEVEERLADMLREEMAADETGAMPTPTPAGALVCTLDPARSRIVGAANETVPFEWSSEGCVNGRTQYGLQGGAWSRVFVPADESHVSVNRFDPATGEYRMERYLLSREELALVRQARREYEPPACAAGEDAAQELGERQAAILSLLPSQPNERLVYGCKEAE
jgi:S1-C subfamily serine protease